jgi:peptidoglycan/xylan/chitin deacetylase (PgdA/CDA1 family)
VFFVIFVVKISPMNARIYLTFDIEPDYARTTTYRILDQTGPFFDWLCGEKIPATAFVIGKLFEQGHPILDRLHAASIPIEVHGYSHGVDTFGDMHASHAEEIEKGTEAYTKRFGQQPIGYRAPSGIISASDIQLLAKLGYRYDSSVFPMKRPHRFDFSRLPHHPFRWEGTDLLEFPFGLLTSFMPAGLTFMNLLGPRLSAFLGTRRAKGADHYIVDGHFHNLFHDDEALQLLPPRMQWIYRLGRLQGGFTAFKKVVNHWRKAGYEFGNLQQDVLKMEVLHLPVVQIKDFLTTKIT